MSSVRVTTDPAEAARALAEGHLAVLPTETVYGLGAQAELPHAIARVYAVKGRPADHPLIVHVANAHAAWQWGRDVPAYAHALAEAFWPGPLTLVVARSSRAGDFVTGGQDTVALRVSGHWLVPDVFHHLSSLTGDPAVGIAAPSANRFGRVSPTTVEHVRDELDALLTPHDVVLDGGPSRVGVESTIVDCSGHSPVVLRPGHVSAHGVEQVTGLPVGMHSRVRAPGTLESHYAPRASVRLVTSGELRALPVDSEPSVGLLAMAGVPTPDGYVRLSEPEDTNEYAQVLYASLREADALGLRRVLAVPPPEEGVGAAVIDRLTRAAAGS